MEAPEAAGLGDRLRARRQAAGLSLAALADVTGLTKGYLSKVERGVGQPSIGTIYRLAEALGLPAAQLLTHGGPPSALADIARASPATPPPDGELQLRPLFPSNTGQLIALEMWPPLQARPSEDTSTHAGEELLHVLSGQMEILFEDQTLRLNTGDTLRFDARRPHRTRSLGPQRARVLLVLVEG